MIIKIKKKGLLFDSRDKYEIKVDNFIFKEDFMLPEKENFNVFFKGDNLSGIIEMNKEEVEAIVNAGSQRKNILREIDFLKSGVENISFVKKKKLKYKKRPYQKL